MMQLLWTITWQSLKKLSKEISYNPAIPLLDIYPREGKNMLTQKLVHNFKPGQFITSKRWKKKKQLMNG